VTPALGRVVVDQFEGLIASRVGPQVAGANACPPCRRSRLGDSLVSGRVLLRPKWLSPGRVTRKK